MIVFGMLGRMKARWRACLTFVFFLPAALVQAAVESLPVKGSGTGVDIGPEDGYLDWYDNHPGWVGDNGYTAYRTAAQFALTIPSGSTVASAFLNFNITNSGETRQLEVNLIKGDGRVGLGVMEIRGLAQRYMISPHETAALKMDVTSLVSSLISTGAAFVDFNLHEVSANTNHDPPMTLLLSGAGAPELVVDYTSGPAPAGHFQYQIGTNDGPRLWDLGGALPNGFEHLASGKLTAYKGTGVVKGDVTGINLRFAYVVPGSPGESERYSFALALDPAAKTLFGSETYKAITVSCDTLIGPCHRNVTTYTSQVNYALPQANDGGWTLDLALSSKSSSLSGNAFLTFANGDIFQFRVRGKLSNKTQQASLVLLGTGTGVGASLLISTTIPDMAIQSIRGKFGGQKIDWHL
jgi:hypothetical protein